MTELGSFLFIDSASSLLGPETTANSCGARPGSPY